MQIKIQKFTNSIAISCYFFTQKKQQQQNKSRMKIKQNYSNSIFLFNASLISLICYNYTINEKLKKILWLWNNTSIKIARQNNLQIKFVNDFSSLFCSFVCAISFLMSKSCEKFIKCKLSILDLIYNSIYRIVNIKYDSWVEWMQCVQFYCLAAFFFRVYFNDTMIFCCLVDYWILFYTIYNSFFDFLLIFLVFFSTFVDIYLHLPFYK